MRDQAGCRTTTRLIRTIEMRNIWYLFSVITSVVFIVLFLIWLLRLLVIG